MDAIYHEKQEGQLCAQHCLNNLLQGPLFTAVDLAGFARELDEAEKARMAEGGFTSEYLKFVQQPSSNMDDSGYFSVQVITKAVRIWNLDLVPLSSPAMKHAMEDPTSQRAFICNHDYHWLTVRKLGRQWFNLNSLLKRPKLISDTYLSLFLTQLQMEGYSMFVVVGSLPSCEADDLLTLVPVEQEPSPPPPSQPSGNQRRLPRKTKASESSNSDDESYAIQLATAMSVSMAKKQCVEKSGTSKSEHCDVIAVGSSEDEIDELQMAAAVSASLDDPKQDLKVEEQSDGSSSSSSGGGGVPLSMEELRQRRLLHLGQIPHQD